MAFELSQTLLEEVETCQGEIRHSVGEDVVPCPDVLAR